MTGRERSAGEQISLADLRSGSGRPAELAPRWCAWPAVAPPSAPNTSWVAITLKVGFGSFTTITRSATGPRSDTGPAIAAAARGLRTRSTRRPAPAARRGRTGLACGRRQLIWAAAPTRRLGAPPSRRNVRHPGPRPSARWPVERRPQAHPPAASSGVL
jgi:hypothetical protein